MDHTSQLRDLIEKYDHARDRLDDQGRNDTSTTAARRARARRRVYDNVLTDLRAIVSDEPMLLDDDAVVEAFAQVLATTHRKLRMGERHPERPGEPNTLAFAIAKALVRRGILHG